MSGAGATQWSGATPAAAPAPRPGRGAPPQPQRDQGEPRDGRAGGGGQGARPGRLPPQAPHAAAAPLRALLPLPGARERREPPLSQAAVPACAPVATHTSGAAPASRQGHFRSRAAARPGGGARAWVGASAASGSANNAALGPGRPGAARPGALPVFREENTAGGCIMRGTSPHPPTARSPLRPALRQALPRAQERGRRGRRPDPSLDG